MRVSYCELLSYFLTDKGAFDVQRYNFSHCLTFIVLGLQWQRTLSIFSKPIYLLSVITAYAHASEWFIKHRAFSFCVSFSNVSKVGLVNNPIIDCLSKHKNHVVVKRELQTWGSLKPSNLRTRDKLHWLNLWPTKKAMFCCNCKK